MDPKNLIDKVLEGNSADAVLDSFHEQAPNPFKIRKLMRTFSPRLFKFLSERGDLHDFAMVLAAKKKGTTVNTLVKQHEIPPSLAGELTKLFMEV